MRTSDQLNKNYLVRYYPKSNRVKNHLVGFNRMKTLTGDIFTFYKMLDRVEKNKDDQIRVNLRRGIAFEFTRR